MKFRDFGWMRDEFAKALAIEDGPGSTEVATDAATLATWTDAASKRAPVLFVGAGWTLNDANRDRASEGSRVAGKRALTWAQLCDLLRRNLQPDVMPDESVDPLWLAELYRQRHGAEALHRVLEQAVPRALQPGELHRILFKVTWHSVLTTNYDTLLEQALGQFGAFRSCVEDSDLVLSQSSTALEVIHLHGVISRPETIVLAYEDYRQYPKNHPGFLAKVRQLFLQHPVMFLGFGATDPNFLQWSGWLNDVVGEFKNPWISLTHTPPRGLALGRYWGTRLQFVTLPNPSKPGAFDEVVKSVFGVISRALDEDAFDQSVVARRFLSCGTVDAVFQTTNDLLAVGNARGYTGTKWENSKQVIFQCGGSKLLDLAGVPWRRVRENVPTSELARETVPTIELIVQDPAWASPDLIRDMEVAVGSDHWRQWLQLVRNHTSDRSWDFSRVRLDEWHEDWWNRFIVELPPDGSSSGAGNASVRADAPESPTETTLVPKTPLDHRKAAFLAFEDGDWAQAARLYAEAARISREHDEPLRVRLLTLWSIRECVLGGWHFSTSSESGELGELLRGANEAAREVEKQLRTLPHDEQLTQLNERESEARETLSKALLDSILNPLGRQPSVHFGRPHVAATDLFEFLDQNWFAQGVIHSAAKLLGLNQWIAGLHRDALVTLYRYGSSLPKQLLDGLACRLNIESVDMPPLIAAALDFDGSFGSQLSRVESLGGLVPWLSVEQLVDIRTEVASLRHRLATTNGGLTRGTTRISSWETHVALDEVEQACWRWMPLPEAFDALKEWIRMQSRNAISEDPVGRGLSGILGFNWRGIRESSVLREHVPGLVRELAENAISLQEDAQRNGNMQICAWILVQLWTDELVHLNSDCELTRLFEQMLDCMPPLEKAVLSAQKARLMLDEGLVGECLNQAVPAADSEPQLKEFTALRVVAVLAEYCHQHAPAIAELVTRLLNRIRDEKANDDGNPFARFGKMEAEVGPLLAELLLKWPESSAVRLVECATVLVDMYPPASEHFSGMDPAKLGSLQPIVQRNVRALLHGGFGESSGTARDQRFAGTRALVRAVSSQHGWILDSDTAVSLAILMDSPVGPLASYATWALAEWATKGVSSSSDEILRLAIVPALRRAARDRRLGVEVNGVRGLAAVSRVLPDLVPERELEGFRLDHRIAMQRVFDGLASNVTFASVL